MFRACLVLTYVCIIHALPSSTTRLSTKEPPNLQSRLNQDWSPDVNIRDEARNSLLANPRQPVVTRLRTQIFFKNVQNYQTPLNSVQASGRDYGKGAVLPQIIQSHLKYYPQSAHAASNWDDARNVMLSNLSPQQLPQPEHIPQDDNTLTQNQSPLHESVWEDTKAVFELKPSPSYQEQNEIDDDNLKDLLLPNNNPALAKSKQPSLTTWEDVQGRFTAGLALPSNPKLWKPPSYFQSLSELEDAMANIKMHL